MGFKEVGCEVNVLVTKYSDKLKNFSKYNIIEIYDKDKGLKKLRWLYYRIPQIIKTVRMLKPDIIIQQCAGINTLLYALMAKIFKVKFVYHIANDIEVDGRLTKK